MIDDDDTESTERDKRITAAIKFMHRVSDSESHNRERGRYWRKFRWGEQWPAEITQSRTLENRPCIVVNKTDTFCRQVENQQRQQRPRIKVDPTNGQASKRTAEIIKGMIKHIESARGGADMAYDGGFSGQITEGVGYWRIMADYVRPDSFEQELFLSPILDQGSVYYDPNAVMPDGSDAEEVLISVDMPRASFKSAYPKADPGENFRPSDMGGFNDGEWMTRDTVRVAEYFYVEIESETLCKLKDGRIGWLDQMKKATPNIALGTQEDRRKAGVVDERTSCRRTIKWIKCNAVEVLDERDLPGRWIPVIRALGEVAWIDGKVRRAGLVKNAVGPAQMANFWKPLALDTPIPTPSGWTTMGSLQAGDMVFDEQGKPCKVVGTSPTHINRKCYRVRFADGSEIVADAEHPWQVETRGKRISAGNVWTMDVVRTDELRPKVHRIVVPAPLQLADADLPVHPYVLGIWLGDGTVSCSSITAGDEDIDELRVNLMEAEDGCLLSDKRRSGERAQSFSIYGLRAKLREIGLLDNKVIPREYLRASQAQRWGLLQGLMDTDGSISGAGLCSWTSMNSKLASGFSELLSSLGIKAHRMIRKDRARSWANGTVTTEHGEEWQFSFSAHSDQPIFRMTRKLNRLPLSSQRHDRRVKRIRIHEVVEVASVPVKCIAVDTPSHLFLAGRSMVPTHNTAMTETVALAPKAKWLLAEGQDEGHEQEWASANISARPTLRYKPSDVVGREVPPPQRVQPEPPPAGAMAMAESVDRDLTAVLGIVDPAMRIGGNVSGKALNSERMQSDNSTFNYFDSMVRSIAHTGRILLDLMPYYYSEPGRVVRIIGDDGQSRTTAINQADPKDPEKVLNDVTAGEYDVVMDAGPGYNTKRQEALETMAPIFQQHEELMKIAGDVFFRNMDFPGSDVIADRLAAANPLSQVDEESEIPPAVQMKLKQQAQQLQQLTQHAQQLEQMIKSRADLESMKEAAESHRLSIKEAAQTGRNDADNQAWMHDIQTKAMSHISGKEIDAAARIITQTKDHAHDAEQFERQADHEDRQLERQAEKAPT